jgi:hypothetical protein
VKEQIEYNTKYVRNKNIDTIEQNMSPKGTRLAGKEQIKSKCGTKL